MGMKEQLNFALKGTGEQCVMIRGTTRMPRWCVDNLDLEL